MMGYTKKEMDAKLQDILDLQRSEISYTSL